MRIPFWSRPLLFGMCWVCLFLLSCAAKSAQPGDSCTTDDDCISTTGDTLECRAKKCRTPITNSAPTAEIIARPESGVVGQRIRLDGGASEDKDNDNLSYAWTLKEKPENSKAELENEDQVNTSFVADQPGDYVIELVVTDSSDKKNKSEPVTFTVSVKDLLNNKPIANAGEDQIVGPNSKVQLDGSKSIDPDAQKLSYAWKFKITPDGSQANIENADSETPTFTTDQVGKYVVELIVTDERGEASDPDSVTIVSMVGHDKQPAITNITPKEGLLGEKVDVTIEGTDFVDGAEVRIGTNTIKATYESETKLKVQLDLSGLTPREYEVFVINPNEKASRPPGKFIVKGIPQPQLNEIKPNISFVGAKVKLRALGDNFFEKSEVLFQSVPLPTTYVSKNEVEFELDLTKTVPGIYSVKVRNNPGNLLSNEVKFTVSGQRPKPVLRVLNPPFGPEDGSLAFSVHGQGFERGAVIKFDGTALKTKYIRRDELQVEGDLDLKALGKKAGNYDVWVTNPDGQDSEKLKFRVRGTDPTPRLDRILPFALFLDEDMKVVAIYGQEFLKGAKIRIDGKEIGPTAGKFGQVTWKSDTYMEARVDLRDAAQWKAGDTNAQVINPNGKASNNFRITISYRVPSVNGLVPSAWTTKCDTDVEVHGLNFVPKAQVRFGSLVFSATSTTNKLTYVSDKILKFRLNATKLAAQSYNVVVENGTNAKSSNVAFKIDNAASLTPFPRYISPSVGLADTTGDYQRYT